MEKRLSGLKKKTKQLTPMMPANPRKKSKSELRSARQGNCKVPTLKRYATRYLTDRRRQAVPAIKNNREREHQKRNADA